MAENRRGRENRFYFSRGQMVLLGAAFTLASAIIFVLGIFVGKSIEGRKLLKNEEPLVRIPVKPSAPQPGAGPVSQAQDEITFNNLPAKPPASAALAPEKGREAKAAEKPPAEKEQDDGKREARAIKANQAKEVTSAPAAPAKKAEGEAAEPKDQARVWRAQVNAYPDERSAKQIVDRLKNKGYNAYVTEVQNRGKTWFRVSVGRYNSREEADKMVEVLRSKENFPKAFAASR